MQQYFISVLLVSGSIFPVIGQTPDCCTNDGYNLFKIIQQYHVSRPPLNDFYATRIFNEFFTNLDPEAKFLCSKDLAKYNSYKGEIDKLLIENNSDFLIKISQLFKSRIEGYSKRADSLLAKPLNFDEAEHLAFNQTTGFVTDPSDLVILQKKIYKLTLLEASLQQTTSITNSADFVNFEKTFRSKIHKQEYKQLAKIRNYSGGMDGYVCQAFIQAIASAADPHTTYFSNDQFADFQTSLSSEGLSFGFTLEDDRSGDIRIGNIIPNGPAWNSSKIASGDILMGYSIGEEFTDVSLFDSYEVIHLLNSSSIQEVRLHLQDLNKTQKTVSLFKSRIELSENLLKGLTLVGEKRIGYISLPGFYTQWESSRGESSANDLAKEILKLKKEKIDGLIIDLRFNGGGSMQEAFDFIGLFIDTGPLAIIKNQEGTLLVARDMNRGTVYDGPLAILVNSLSASASEIVVGTLQDYNRALIIGSPTYGKATAQVLLPLRNDLTGVEESAGIDFRGESLKITTEKIYRITGKSYQKCGVQPDVFLNDLTTGLGYLEKDSPTSLEVDSVIKKTYYTPFPSLPNKELAVLSINRLRESTKKINHASTLLTAAIPLRREDFIHHAEKLQQATDNLKPTNPTAFTLQSIAFDSRLHTIDSYKRESDQRLIEELSESLHIQEAYHILVDLINYKEK